MRGGGIVINARSMYTIGDAVSVPVPIMGTVFAPTPTPTPKKPATTQEDADIAPSRMALGLVSAPKLTATPQPSPTPKRGR